MIKIIQSVSTQMLVDAATKCMNALVEQGHYEEALAISLQITQAHPYMSDGWAAVALHCAYLKRWQNAVHYGQTALACGGDRLEIYDVLAHAHGMLGQWDEARCYGLQALNMRDRLFGGKPAISPPAVGAMPPLPCAQTRERNIIAFSLFGHDSKYCETAILNAQDQPQIYPHWICRFYVDDTVPASVIGRLQKSGAQIVHVKGSAAQWPGEMWRLLTLDDPLAQRILFRDADSIISQREAGAVEQWLTSGKRFHIMRDNGGCTELIQAGMWGMVAGSLPPLKPLIQLFMRALPRSRHFADQDFLRKYVWPYARTSLLQHDSVFGFMDAVLFPDGERRDDFQVGRMESTVFVQETDKPDGTKIFWSLYWIIEKYADGKARVKLICSYPGIVKDKKVSVYIPKRYAKWIEQGKACILQTKDNEI